MEKNKQLHYVLKRLSEMQIALELLGGPEENGEIFEKILEIQEKILSNFGLPTNHPDFEKILHFKTPPTDYEVYNRVKQLHQTAIDYFSNKTPTDIELLKSAQETERDAFHVLAELSLPTHTYTIFVYNEILQKNKDTVENILQELNFVNKPELLEILEKLEEQVLTDENEIIQLLELVGLKYIEQFILFIKTQ